MNVPRAEPVRQLAEGTLHWIVGRNAGAMLGGEEYPGSGLYSHPALDAYEQSASRKQATKLEEGLFATRHQSWKALSRDSVQDHVQRPRLEQYMLARLHIGIRL